jgi:hypothetical protein
MSASKTPGTSGNACIAVNGCPEFLGFVPGVPAEQLAVCGSPFAVHYQKEGNDRQKLRSEPELPVDAFRRRFTNFRHLWESGFKSFPCLQSSLV